MSDAGDSVAVTNPDTRSEPSDVDVRGIAGLLAGLAAFVVLAVVILGVIFSDAIRYRDKRLTELPPEPRLQTDEPGDLHRFNTETAQRLASYGYVDPEHRIAHIPIKEAMRQIAEHGIADWPGSKR
jgi:hypothetical protein